jgi:hypothetical protein
MARRRAVEPIGVGSQWIAAGWLGLVTSTPEGERRSALARHGMRERLVQALRRASNVSMVSVAISVNRNVWERQPPHEGWQLRLLQ